MSSSLAAALICRPEKQRSGRPAPGAASPRAPRALVHRRLSSDTAWVVGSDSLLRWSRRLHLHGRRVYSRHHPVGRHCRLVDASGSPRVAPKSRPSCLCHQLSLAEKVLSCALHSAQPFCAWSMLRDTGSECRVSAAGNTQGAAPAGIPSQIFHDASARTGRDAGKHAAHLPRTVNAER